MLVACMDGQVGCEAVKIDGGLDRLVGLGRKLSEQACDEAGEQVATAAFGHAGIAGGVDSDLSIRVGDERARTFEY